MTVPVARKIPPGQARWLVENLLLRVLVFAAEDSHSVEAAMHEEHRDHQERDRQADGEVAVLLVPLQFLGEFHG